MAGRRRNQAGLVVLAAVPVIMAIALRVRSRAGGGGFLRSALENGLFVPLAALTAEMTFFLPLAVAMVAGDTVAGEAHQGTLRYLLTVPVDRTRLLIVKYLALIIGAITAVATVVVVGGAVGVGLFGAGPFLTLSGTTLGFWTALGRLGLIAVYAVIMLSAVAAVGLFVSTLTEQPMAATVSIMACVILSWILMSVDQLAWLHPWLLVRWFMSFADLLRDPIHWTNVGRGAALAAGYIAVFCLAAWARLAGKDITS